MTSDQLEGKISIIAGADVKYDDRQNLIAGATEMPPLLAAFEKLKNKPDVSICDGHGVAHSRKFGLACHLGLTLNLPAIGRAKTNLIG